LGAQEDLTADQAQERTHIGEQLPFLEMAWLLKEELRAWYATATVTTAAQDHELFANFPRKDGKPAIM
jgi:hypothetical protein